MVAQHFPPRALEAAKAAAAFLQANGVPCAIETKPKDIELIATEPFLFKQSGPAAQTEKQRCDALKRRVKELGKEYSKTHGYAFDQCYEREQP